MMESAGKRNSLLKKICDKLYNLAINFYLSKINELLPGSVFINALIFLKGALEAKDPKFFYYLYNAFADSLMTNLVGNRMVCGVDLVFSLILLSNSSAALFPMS